MRQNNINLRAGFDVDRARSSTPTSSVEALDRDRWTHNAWNGLYIRNIITSSSSIVHLSAGSETYLVHRELLTHFSQPLWAVLSDTITTTTAAAATSDALTLPNLTSNTASTFIYWLYSGKLVSSDGEDSSDTDLISLYVFATQFQILALRRDIIDLLHHYARTSHVPPPSADLYVNHGDELQATAELERLPKQFLTAVMLGKSRCLKRAREFPMLEKRGFCCIDTCNFHEHECWEEKSLVVSNNNTLVGGGHEKGAARKIAIKCPHS
ncbi:hypothetical protein H2203_007300 [Taxawa tesnikishii (nom. ined.)]|nr:hypothetical protein H2203_007300 [Dothideales sp. JES 119]